VSTFCLVNIEINWLLSAEVLSGSREQTQPSPPTDSSGELRVVMVLMKPEMILVEDATKLTSEALIMTVSLFVALSV